MVSAALFLGNERAVESTCLSWSAQQGVRDIRRIKMESWNETKISLPENVDLGLLIPWPSQELFAARNTATTPPIAATLTTRATNRKSPPDDGDLPLIASSLALGTLWIAPIGARVIWIAKNVITPNNQCCCFISLQKFNIYRIKVSQKYLIYFGKQNHCQQATHLCQICDAIM